MPQPAQEIIGEVVSLWRYPVKSMMGEELNAAEVGERGLLGDRAYALLDTSDGKVASAKNPGKWPQLFQYRAAFVEPPRSGAKMPAVRVTLPDGTVLASDEAGINEALSRALEREVTLEAAAEAQGAGRARQAEEYWPSIEGLDFQDTVTDFELPEGTFFDCAVVHVLTTATLNRLRELYPQGRFEVRRFRPNVVVEMSSPVKDFVEDAWIGQTLRLGDEVRLAVTGPCPRCVMITLAQGDLPKDSGILRTAAQTHEVNVGVYASVLRGGQVRRGDAIRLEPVTGSIS
ncbi:MOSC domain-containing protein [Nonomuraea jabiensis]|uniref:MOSC domain-containing protein n=1 Tax=Nonomuraea jabiensis TaxID=882448 RepID=UPI003D720833